MLGHIPEVLGLLVLGLIIFGPKRMIEMGGQLGRMWRELQSALKDMSWNPLTDDTSTSPSSSQSTLGRLSQMAQNVTAQRDAQAESTPAPHVVEATPQSASGDMPTDAQ